MPLADPPSPNLPVQAHLVAVEKGKHLLTLYRGNSAIATYSVALGQSGAKAKEGDGKTPEGRYTIDWRNARSRFHRSLHISYPSAADRARASAIGNNPGGDIMIHGLPGHMAWLGPLHRTRDWTLGCIAVTNQEIEQIWRLVPDGTPIEIRP
ncbi:MAG: L,D-transpeptidase family protein [Candidatus Sericytochromatia bacterium]|uniref:L,D-transpeptidase family protein n=1 Tax=Candidatus Tanganyikabacteria bacterium TaxID=2961651 RepID=A0A937X4M3_9BACT|nr:L,D-transpeptidase family protein [Candidatus Tanganyikabacteria bacterium]